MQAPSLTSTTLTIVALTRALEFLQQQKKSLQRKQALYVTDAKTFQLPTMYASAVLLQIHNFSRLPRHKQLLCAT